MPDQSRRPAALRIIQWAIVLAIFLFLANMLRENWAQVKEAPFTLRPWPLMVSTLIFALSYFIQLWAWHLITVKLGIGLPFAETSEAWFTSQLGKYIPGKVWLFLGRLYLYQSRGKPKKLITVALYFETITILTAALFLSSVPLVAIEGTRPPQVEPVMGWLVGLSVLSLILLHPRWLEKILNRALVRLGREPFTYSLLYRDVLVIVLVCLLAWLVGGAGFYLFVDAVYPVAPKYFFFLTGALAFSSILGLIALVAPSGLGVREGALVYCLSFIMPPPVGVIISILTRVWMTLIEIGLIAVVYLTGRFRRTGGRGDGVQIEKA